MKSMTLTTTREPIPTNILMLAADINARVGDRNISVAIRDEDTGREYIIKPAERRISHDAQRSNRSRRAL